jgi:hypothetical protein
MGDEGTMDEVVVDDEMDGLLYELTDIIWHETHHDNTTWGDSRRAAIDLVGFLRENPEHVVRILGDGWRVVKLECAHGNDERDMECEHCHADWADPGLGNRAWWIVAEAGEGDQ